MIVIFREGSLLSLAAHPAPSSRRSSAASPPRRGGSRCRARHTAQQGDGTGGNRQSRDPGSGKATCGVALHHDNKQLLKAVVSR